jgi:alpha-1,3/alpha-1,6-mannosyltransferase
MCNVHLLTQYSLVLQTQAMYAGVPVVAVASGGPLETVVDGKTGYLCDGVPAAFAEAFAKLTPKAGVELKRKMGLAGHERVKKTFTLDLFADRLDAMVQELYHDMEMAHGKQD